VLTLSQQSRGYEDPLHESEQVLSQPEGAATVEWDHCKPFFPFFFSFLFSFRFFFISLSLPLSAASSRNHRNSSSSSHSRPFGHGAEDDGELESQILVAEFLKHKPSAMPATKVSFLLPSSFLSFSIIHAHWH